METIDRIYGFVQSALDGTEDVFNQTSEDLPEEYDYRPYLPKVLDQGKTNMCVTYSISAHLDWNYNVDHGVDNTEDNNVNRNEIYAIRQINWIDGGMTFKEALNFLHNTGVDSDNGKLKIEHYALIKSIDALKFALILNGPCVAGLMVYNPKLSNFWTPNGNKSLGGHAIAIVGYTKNGFIIRNSWSEYWGDNGYSILPYNDFNKILECWTIID